MVCLGSWVFTCTCCIAKDMVVLLAAGCSRGLCCPPASRHSTISRLALHSELLCRRRIPRRKCEPRHTSRQVPELFYRSRMRCGAMRKLRRQTESPPIICREIGACEGLGYG